MHRFRIRYRRNTDSRKMARNEAFLSEIMARKYGNTPSPHRRLIGDKNASVSDSPHPDTGPPEMDRTRCVAYPRVGMGIRRSSPPKIGHRPPGDTVGVSANPPPAWVALLPAPNRG